MIFRQFYYYYFQEFHNTIMDSNTFQSNYTSFERKSFHIIQKWNLLIQGIISPHAPAAISRFLGVWTPSMSRGRIIKTLVKLQYSAPCISSYNMKATMCQQCCKSGSSKIDKFIVVRLYLLLRRAHCSQHVATYNM